MKRRTLGVIVGTLGIVACSSSAETSTKAVDGSASMTGGATSAGGGARGGAGGSSVGSGGTSGNAGASATGGESGVQCRTSADCPQTNCFGCPGVACVNGQCVAAVSGSAGTNGSGGNSAGGTGGGRSMSPGTATIGFTVTGSYCHGGCSFSPSIGIEDSTGRAVVIENPCRTDCATCAVSKSCPTGPCVADGVVTGANLVWDGSYYATSTCGSGTSCSEQTFAPPGKYIAVYCATPGVLTGRDGGPPHCTTTGPEKCGSVDFDFPSSTVVKGTLGP